MKCFEERIAKKSREVKNKKEGVFLLLRAAWPDHDGRQCSQWESRSFMLLTRGFQFLEVKITKKHFQLTSPAEWEGIAAAAQGINSEYMTTIVNF